MWTMFLHLSNFGLDLTLSFVEDYSNTETRPAISEECLLRFSAQMTMQFGYICYSESFVDCFYLINNRFSYWWVPVIFWLNSLTLAIDFLISPVGHLVWLAVDSSLDSSTLLHIHYGASHGFYWELLVLSENNFSIELIKF